MTLGDLVLDWMSEIGAGSWADARETIASLQAEEGANQPAWRVAADLEDSGHIEVDWPGDRWSTASPALCVVRGTSLCAVWTGARPRRRRQRLQKLLLDNTSIFDFYIPQPPGPTARFVKGGCVDDLECCARDLGLELLIDPASSMAECLPALPESPNQLAAAPAASENVEWFNPRTLRWLATEPFESHWGLFRIERHGRHETRWRDKEGNWFVVEQPVGMFMTVRSETKRSILRWRPATNRLAHPTFLEVRQPMILPTLARRAAVASSGLLPLRDGRWTRFRNVSRRNAKRIAASLGQKLEVIRGDA